MRGKVGVKDSVNVNSGRVGVSVDCSISASFTATVIVTVFAIVIVVVVIDSIRVPVSICVSLSARVSFTSDSVSCFLLELGSSDLEQKSNKYVS